MNSLLLGLVALSQSLAAPPPNPPPAAEPPAPAVQPVSLWPKLGATIHVDGNAIDEDTAATFGSGVSGGDDGVYFRRLQLSLSGQLLGLRYRFEPEFAPMTDGGDFAFENAYVGLPLGPGELQVGQRRPFHSMEDLTNSNDTVMIERPFTGSAGVFAGGQDREFGLGAFYHGAYDVLTWGIGAYDLRAINASGDNGLGVSVRATWAPLLAVGQVLHLGASGTYERPSSGTPPTDIRTTVAYAGRRGPRTVVGSASGGEPATTAGLEFADATGPYFVQGEFMLQNLQQAGALPEQDILAWYVQGSVFLTGETRPYDRRNGVFGTPSPRSRAGAWELTARYDEAVNQDAESFGGCDGGVFPDGCEVRSITAGVNYYLNPSMRFMLNYSLGEQDRGPAGKDKPKALAGRLQYAF